MLEQGNRADAVEGEDRLAGHDHQETGLLQVQVLLLDSVVEQGDTDIKRNEERREEQGGSEDCSWRFECVRRRDRAELQEEREIVPGGMLAELPGFRGDAKSEDL